MSRALITESFLTGIANAIRAKLGVQDTYTPPQMAAAIESIPTGGITPTGTKNITQNGTHDVTQYASANVNVPNSYAAGDEGKVVSNGALVAQTSRSVTANGTYDTTTNDEVVVSVAPNLQSKTVTENGTVTPDQGYDGLSSVVVNVSGGGGSDGVYVGTGDPDASIGSDGDYYYKRALTGAYGYTSTPNNDSGTSQTGYEFIANEAITITGLRALNTNTNGTISLLLARLDGTVLGRIDNVPVNGAWTAAYLDTPIQLTAGEHYIVQATRNGQGFRYQAKSQTAFNSKITGVQGRYGSLPGSTDSANIYSADIIIATADSVYVVTKQYYKSSGAWEVIA